MSWRTIVVASNAKLDYQMGFLVVRKDTITKVHINEIETLILESTAISLTASLVSELLKRKVKIIFCDEKRNPCGEIIPYVGRHDSSLKIREQMAWGDIIKKTIWTEIVSEKLYQQKTFLLELKKYDEAMLLENYLQELQFADITNREGHAAKVYFNAIFGKTFSRSVECPINAALNYGYTIILSAFNREIVNNGYLTQLGIFHDNRFNFFNLSSDLMEPFRIMVDRQIYKMQLKKFEHEEKMQILSILNQEVIISGRKEFLSNAIKIYCKSIFEAINVQDVSLIKFYRNEL